MQAKIEQSYRNIGDNVYRFRMLQHMTQDELAEKSYVSSSYISQIERARLHKGITCTAMIHIAKTLGVPVCILMSDNPCDQYLECLSHAALHRPTLRKEEMPAPPKKGLPHEPKVSDEDLTRPDGNPVDGETERLFPPEPGVHV